MAGRWKAGGVAVLLTVVSVAIAYRFPATLELELGRSFPSALAIDGFHDAEQGYRWTRARSRIAFRDPGASPDARLELEISGFRPRGAELPILVVETPRDSARLEPSRRVTWYALAARTDGWWSSDLDVRLRSETFSPGGGDTRALGVRIQRARLVVPGAAFPPFRQLLFASIAAGLFVLLQPERRGSAIVAGALPLVLAVGYAWARVYVTLLVPALALCLLAVAAVRWLAPSAARAAVDVLGASAGALARNGRHLLSRRTAGLAVVALSGVWLSYVVAPTFELDLGSGANDLVARRFGTLDREGAVTFRRALAGASLDLRDFGSGSPWTIVVHASASDDDARGVLVSAGERELSTAVARTWEAFELTVPEPAAGWRAGHVVRFPGLGAGVELRIDRVTVDRGRSTPALRPLLMVLGMVLLLSSGLRSTTAAALFGALIVSALALAPVLTIPLLPTLLLAAAVMALLAAGATGVLEVAASRKLLPELAPEALTIALAGFGLWFAAIASPLYVGGHYGFHTDIAEEIWQGRFLHYYLPYPGSMLSTQPQWENLVVPHSCLFHTLASPFAALPRYWFHALTKLFLAALLFGTALGAALVATRSGGARAGMYAAAGSVFIPTGFQLLGLGHLMTLFGTWAGTLALGFIAIHWDRLSERVVFWWAIALLSLCFLSYTGSLLFASLVLVSAGALAYRAHPDRARRLATVVLLGWGASFLLYYVHWTVPFVRDSIPALLTGSGSDVGIDVAARVAGQPGKLAYTFGSPLVPLAGLIGLLFADSTRRPLLLGWGGVLVVFGGLDVFFNFLLKHHYFTYPVVAAGVGLALARLHEKGGVARVILAVLVVSLVWMGLRVAGTVAQGAI